MGWWRSLYDQTLADVLLVRDDPEEVRRTCEFLVEALELPPGGRVFDQCCGIGSLAIPLAERGFDVVGCDLGHGYVERALHDAEARHVSLELYHADARSFVPGVRCHAAFNWWTSFGYSDDDDVNVKMLRAARESLVPGGRFALDFMNVPNVFRTFVPRVETRRRVENGEIVLVRESRVDLARMTMEKTWHFTRPDGSTRTQDTHVRLYTPRELGVLLGHAGFVDVSFVGGLDARPLTLESPRCIALARRRAA